MILIRLILISLIVFLIVRSLISIGQKEEPSLRKTSGHGENDKAIKKRVSKEIGEYVDYEEVDK